MKNFNTVDSMDAVKTTQTATPDNIATSEKKPGSVPALSQLPTGYLANGYLDKNGNVDLRYFVSIPREIAEKLAPMDASLFREMYRNILNTERLPPSIQLREITRLVPISANLLKEGKAPAILLEFCEANAAAVKTLTDCENFRLHMEAIYCFMS